MRIPISALFGMTVTLSSLPALAQPQPGAPTQPPLLPAAQPAGPQPEGAAQPVAPPEAPPALPSPAPAPPEAAPPPPGAPDAASPPPPPPAPVFAAAGEAAPVTDKQPLAGWHGGFFLRDPNDYFRLYPKGRINLDFYSFFGPGVSEVPAVDGGNALQPRFFVRRARLAMAGEFLKRWSFEVEAEFGGQSLSNANGKTQTSASSAGVDPTAETSRFAGVQTTSASVAITDAWVNYSVIPALNFMFGQYPAPFSLENTTSDNSTSHMERNVAIRGFAFPTNRDIGAMAWGEIADKMLVYGIGVFAGDGQNRPGIDSSADFIGRVYARPFAGGDKKGLLAKAQIGVSAMHGDRDQEYVGYDYPAIRTGQGYTLWDPGYRDESGRRLRVIPSGSQNAIGGELRLPIKMVDLRSELYYVGNDTREAVEGYQLTNTERLGELRGISWYAQVSVWFGDAFVSGDPGGSPRPTKVDLSKPTEKPKKGLELAAVIGGINATYDGAAREGEYDPKTPGAPGGRGTDIKIMQMGYSVNYWHTKHVRLTASYTMYSTPDSGTAGNLAVVPGNTIKEPDPDAHAIHELGTRLAVAF